MTEVHDSSWKVPRGAAVRVAAYSRAELTRLIENYDNAVVVRVFELTRDMLDNAYAGACPSHADYRSTCYHCAWRFEVPAPAQETHT